MTPQIEPPRLTLAWWFEGPVIGAARRLGFAVVVSVGPWLVSIIALALVSIAMTPVMGDRAVEDVRLTVVYAFAIAPLIAGPIGAVAARLIRESIEEHGGCEVFDLFRTAALAAGLLAMAVAGAVAVVLGLHPEGVALGCVWATGVAALLWVCFAVLGAIRAYRFLIGSFSAGMLFAFGLVLATAGYTPSVELLVWSFNAGVAMCVALALRHVARAFRRSDDDPGLALRVLMYGIARDWPVAVGIAAAVAAIWMDKIVYWIGAQGLRSAAGFAHYAPYDSVMFVAHLSLIPSLAAMLLFQSGALPQTIAVYRRTLAARATHEEIGAASAGIASTIWGNLFTIVFIQGTCSLVLVLTAPLVARFMDFDLNQFALLRLGVVAIFLQSILYLGSSVLMVCNCTRTFCAIQVIFLTANLVASVTLMHLIGTNSYALFASSMVAAVAAFVAAYRAIVSYDYLVFVGTNVSLYRQDDTDRQAGPRTARIPGRIRMARTDWAARARRAAAADSTQFTHPEEATP